MLTYSYTFRTLFHLGEFYFSEVQYTVAFYFYNNFSILSSSIGYKRNFWEDFITMIGQHLLNKLSII